MDIQEAIKNLESTFEQKTVLSGETMKMAISALQEQAEREKGCEYCNGDALDNLVLTRDIAGTPRIAMHGGNTQIDESEKPVFCPKCGKRLK